MAANKLKFRTLHAVIGGFDLTKDKDGKPKTTQQSPITQHQNANILAKDSAFLSTMLGTILPRLIELERANEVVVQQRYLDELTGSIADSNAIGITHAIVSMFSERSTFKKISGPDGFNESTKIRIHMVGTEIVGDKGEFDITLGTKYDISFDIPVREILSFTPQTRAILGFDQVEFFDSGLIEDAAVFTTVDQTEQRDLERSGKSTVSTYTGVDIITSVSIGKIVTNIDDIKTISYSTHRDIVHARTLGSSYPSGLSRGPRTIAGSMICCVRLRDPMTNIDPQKLIGYDDLVVETDKDLYRESMLPDQYPMFDMLIVYQNEYGDSSALNIYGIAISDTGQTSSISDTETEIQYTYVALDMDPLKKIKFNADGTLVKPFNNEYIKRKKRIIEGNTLHNDPFTTPAIVTDLGNISHLDFVF